MKFTKITILTLTFLAFGLVLSGCVKKDEVSAKGGFALGGKEEVENINQNVDVGQKEDKASDEVAKQDEDSISDSTAEEIDTSSWKTYRNEKYGFEFKYPEEWRVAYSKVDGIDIILYEKDLQISFLSVRLKSSKVYSGVEDYAEKSCNKYSSIVYCNDPDVYNFQNVKLYNYSENNFLNEDYNNLFAFEYYLFYVNGAIFDLHYGIGDGDGKVRTDEQMIKSNIQAKKIISIFKLR